MVEGKIDDTESNHKTGLQEEKPLVFEACFGAFLDFHNTKDLVLRCKVTESFSRAQIIGRILSRSGAFVII